MVGKPLAGCGPSSRCSLRRGGASAPPPMGRQLLGLRHPGRRAELLHRPWRPGRTPTASTPTTTGSPARACRVRATTAPGPPPPTPTPPRRRPRRPRRRAARELRDPAVRRTSGCHVNGPLPDRGCTPGARYAKVTRADVCARVRARPQRLAFAQECRLHRVRHHQALQRPDRRGRPPRLARTRRQQRRGQPVPRGGDSAPRLPREGRAREPLHKLVCEGQLDWERAASDRPGLGRGVREVRGTSSEHVVRWTGAVSGSAWAIPRIGAIAGRTTGRSARWPAEARPAKAEGRRARLDPASRQGAGVSSVASCAWLT